MNFLNTCEEVGKEYSWVQGGGGNVSIKINNNEMLIKASGIAISEITQNKGLVKVDYNSLIDFYLNNFDNKNADAVITNSVLSNTDSKPSMETGFHSFLGKVVIHTHPVAVNMFVCLKKGRQQLKKLLNYEIIWIDYVTPGHDLALSVMNAVKNKDLEKPIIILLENHGLIISTHTVEENLKLNKEIIHKTERHIQSKGCPEFTETEFKTFQNILINNEPIVAEYCSSFQEHKYLFPDAVVFGYKFFNGLLPDIKLENDKKIRYSCDEKRAKKIDAILKLHMYLSLNIPEFGLPNYLPDTEIEKLLNLESEKYRENVSK